MDLLIGGGVDDNHGKMLLQGEQVRIRSQKMLRSWLQVRQIGQNQQQTDFFLRLVS